MELVTTIREFNHEVTVRHLAPDTHIRVIIDEPAAPIHRAISPEAWLPRITPEEQLERLSRLPHETNPCASGELVQIIERSHVNTEPVGL